MTDFERDSDPDVDDDALMPDGPLTPEEAEDDPAYSPDDEELGRFKGG